MSSWDDSAVVYGRGSEAAYIKGLGVAVGGSAVTPDDDGLGFTARALWVGGAGNVDVTAANGDSVLFTSVPAGTWLPIAVTVVKETTTTATNIVALK